MIESVGTATATAVLVGLLAFLVLGQAGRRHVVRPLRGRHTAPDTNRPRGIAAVNDQWRHVRRRRVARSTVTAAAVAEWCDALARSLRAGMSLRAALEFSIPADAALAFRCAALQLAMRRGSTVTSAVAHLGSGDRRRHRQQQTSSHLALASAVLSTAGSVGGPSAASLDRLAGALRLRVADGEERASHSAQARLSAHVLTVVPLGLLALLTATDREVRTVVTSGIGVGVLGLGLSLNLAGWLWMRRIIETRR